MRGERWERASPQPSAERPHVPPFQRTRLTSLEPATCSPSPESERCPSLCTYTHTPQPESFLWTGFYRQGLGEGVTSSTGGVSGPFSVRSATRPPDQCVCQPFPASSQPRGDFSSEHSKAPFSLFPHEERDTRERHLGGLASLRNPGTRQGRRSLVRAWKAGGDLKTQDTSAEAPRGCPRHTQTLGRKHQRQQILCSNAASQSHTRGSGHRCPGRRQHRSCSRAVLHPHPARGPGARMRARQRLSGGLEGAGRSEEGRLAPALSDPHSLRTRRSWGMGVTAAR